MNTKRRGVCILLVIAMVLNILITGCSKGEKTSAKTESFETEPVKSETEPIKSADEVIKDMNELGTEYGYKNAFSELKEQSTITFDGETFYRYSQYYQGIPVYGKSVVYVTDEKGTCVTMTGNVADVYYQGALTPKLTQEHAQESVLQYVQENWGVDQLQMLNLQALAEDSLCIYSHEDGTANLAHQLEVTCNNEPFEVVIADEDGEVLSWTQKIQYEGISSEVSGADINDDSVSFNAYQREADGDYIMWDTERNLLVSDIDGQSLRHIVSSVTENGTRDRYYYNKADGKWYLADGTLYDGKELEDVRWVCSTEEDCERTIPVCTTKTLPWNNPDAVTAL